MKALKRNAVILTVLLFVCAAVYLNWSYGKKEEAAAQAAREAAASGEAAEETAVETAESPSGETEECAAILGAVVAGMARPQSWIRLD